VDPDLAKLGARQFRRCTLCHGFGAIAGSLALDLRASAVVPVLSAFDVVVRGGAKRSLRMPSFKLTDQELLALQHYIRQQADAALSAQGPAK
jgi:quinohemoprotein ethanol dehydrogenase